MKQNELSVKIKIRGKNQKSNIQHQKQHRRSSFQNSALIGFDTNKPIEAMALAKTMRSFLFLVLLLRISPSVECNESPSTADECGVGCFATELAGGGVTCGPVGPGYYSPVGAGGTRMPCPPGTYSDQPRSIECTPCRPGSINGVPGQASCILCPTGFFQDQFGETVCFECNPIFFRGVGSNAVRTVPLTGELLCAMTEQTPTSTPSMPTTPRQPSGNDWMNRHPSVTPTFHPATPSADTTQPMPKPSPSYSSDAPQLPPGKVDDGSVTSPSEPTKGGVFSSSPLQAPPSTVGNDNGDRGDGGDVDVEASKLTSTKTVQCTNETAVYHGNCIACPETNKIHRTLFISLLLWFLLGCAMKLCSPAILLVACEFFQNLLLIEWAGVGIGSNRAWPTVIESALRYLSMMTVHLGETAPLQCLTGLDPQQCRVILMCSAFILATLPPDVMIVFPMTGCTPYRWVLSLIDRYENWASVALVLSFQSFVWTAFESVTCSGQGNDWFCWNTKDWQTVTLTILSTVMAVVTFCWLGLRFYWRRGQHKDSTIIGRSFAMWWTPLFIMVKRFVMVSWVFYFTGPSRIKVLSVLGFCTVDIILQASVSFYRHSNVRLCIPRVLLAILWTNTCVFAILVAFRDKIEALKAGNIVSYMGIGPVVVSIAFTFSFAAWTVGEPDDDIDTAHADNENEDGIGEDDDDDDDATNSVDGCDDESGCSSYDESNTTNSSTDESPIVPSSGQTNGGSFNVHDEFSNDRGINCRPDRTDIFPDVWSMTDESIQGHGQSEP